MSSKNYRYYHLDRGGRLHFAEWFCAASDEHAIERIKAKHPDLKCEIWEGKRLVSKLSPSGHSPGDTDLQSTVGERMSALALRQELGLES